MGGGDRKLSQLCPQLGCTGADTVHQRLELLAALVLLNTIWPGGRGSEKDVANCSPSACVLDPLNRRPPGTGSAWKMRIRIQEHRMFLPFPRFSLHITSINKFKSRTHFRIQIRKKRFRIQISSTSWN